MQGAFEILEKARKNRLALNAVIEKLQEARSIAEGTRALDAARPAAGGGSGYGTETRYIKLIELEEKAAAVFAQYLQSWRAGFEVIKQLEAVNGVCRYSYILRCRYLSADSWENIAKSLDVTTKHCQREKRLALKRLEAL